MALVNFWAREADGGVSARKSQRGAVFTLCAGAANRTRRGNKFPPYVHCAVRAGSM